MPEYFKKQHIVPKCYLDRFATRTDNKYVIGTRILTKDGKIRLFKQSTSRVGYLENYYDVSDKSDPKFWEHYFSEQVDVLCDKPLGSIISSINLSGVDFVLGTSEKNILSKIIIAQLLRVPNSFDYVNNHIFPKSKADIIEQIKRSSVSRKARSKLKNIDNFQLPITTQKEIYLNTSFDENRFNRYISILSQRIWVILVNTISNALPYITSDNPVLVENLAHSDLIGIFPNGLQSPTTCLFFPLSPSIAVANYSDRGIFSYSASKLDGKIQLISDVRYIVERNQHIMDQAYKHSFIPQPFFDCLLRDEI